MELNKIIHQYQTRFQEKYGKRMTRQQTNTMQAVLDCRTARYGMMALVAVPVTFTQHIITPAVTELVPPASTMTPRCGLTGSNKSCCQLIILWSPLPCLPN